MTKLKFAAIAALVLAATSGAQTLYIMRHRHDVADLRSQLLNKDLARYNAKTGIFELRSVDAILNENTILPGLPDLPIAEATSPKSRQRTKKLN